MNELERIHAQHLFASAHVHLAASGVNVDQRAGVGIDEDATGDGVKHTRVPIHVAHGIPLPRRRPYCGLVGRAYRAWMLSSRNTMAGARPKWPRLLSNAGGSRRFDAFPNGYREQVCLFTTVLLPVIGRGALNHVLQLHADLVSARDAVVLIPVPTLDAHPKLGQIRTTLVSHTG